MNKTKTNKTTLYLQCYNNDGNERLEKTALMLVQVHALDSRRSTRSQTLQLQRPEELLTKLILTQLLRTSFPQIMNMFLDFGICIYDQKYGKDINIGRIEIVLNVVIFSRKPCRSLLHSHGPVIMCGITSFSVLVSLHTHLSDMSG